MPNGRGSGKLLVTVKTDPAEGSLDEPEEVYWSSGKYTSSKFGYADWEKVEGAAYDVYLYRGSKNVKKVTDLHTSSYNFYPYMTSEGTYTFRVRAVPADDSVSKYAKKSDWVTSDELYVDEDEVSDGSGQDKDDKTTGKTGTTGTAGTMLETRWAGSKEMAGGVSGIPTGPTSVTAGERSAASGICLTATAIC